MDEFEDRILKERALPAVTQDGHRIRLRSNIAMAAEIASARAHKAEGVGLYRIEYLFLGRDTAPTEEEHYRGEAGPRGVCPAPGPHPHLRSRRGQGEQDLPRDPPEANPVLGMASDAPGAQTSGALQHPASRAAARAAVHGPLRIMLPLISGLRSSTSLAVIEEAKEELLEEEGIAHAADVPIGVMIELPSAALVADVLADHVWIPMSIGTNDLIHTRWPLTARTTR